VYRTRETRRPRGVEGRHVGVERARVGAPGVPGVRAVGEREELEAAVFVPVGLGRGGREHAGVRGLGGGEGDERGGRGGQQAPGEAERRGDVALEREGEHQEVRPRRHLLQTPVVLSRARTSVWVWLALLAYFPSWPHKRGLCAGELQ